MFNSVNAAAVMIFAIVLASACYAVRRLETRPARIASVLAALAVLVGALVPVVRVLGESAAAPAVVVAPAAPATAVSPQASDPAPAERDPAAVSPAVGS